MDGLRKFALVVFCLSLCAILLIIYAPELFVSPVEVSAAKWLNANSFNLDANMDKIVVLEFWATWCAPCRKSIPHLKKLSDKYKGKVIFVSLTDEPVSGKLEDFCKSHNMTWIVGLGSRSGKDYMVRSIPKAFIIYNDEIVWSGHPMEPKFDKTLASLVANKNKM